MSVKMQQKEDVQRAQQESLNVLKGHKRTHLEELQALEVDHKEKVSDDSYVWFLMRVCIHVLMTFKHCSYGGCLTDGKVSTAREITERDSGRGYPS